MQTPTPENNEPARSFLMPGEFDAFMSCKDAFSDAQRKELNARGYKGRDRKIYRTLLREKRNWDQIGWMIEKDVISLGDTFRMVSDILVEPIRRIGDRFKAARQFKRK